MCDIQHHVAAGLQQAARLVLRVTKLSRLPGLRVERTWTFSPVVESGWSENHLRLRAILPGVTELHRHSFGNPRV